jgi:ABC-type sugar transport system ATPase subunit
MAEQGDGALLEVRNVSKRFGGLQALDNATFDLRPREVLAVVGANGAGKSTLMKVLAGAVRPDSGEIRIDGHRVDIPNVHASRRLGIEIVYQDLGLVRNMDAAFNLFLGRPARRWRVFLDRKAMRVKTRQVLDELHISTLRDLNVSVDNLSGGQRQALAIGRTIAWEKRIVILDEPVAALGVEETEEVLRLIERLRDRGSAIIVVSHNMDHVFRLAHRILVMHSGRSVAQLVRAEATVHDVVHYIMFGTAAPVGDDHIQVEAAEVSTGVVPETKERRA